MQLALAALFNSLYYYQLVGGMMTNVEQIGTRFNEQSEQFSMLQAMLANLAGFVEELVVKTAEMQGVEVGVVGGVLGRFEAGVFEAGGQQ